MNKRTNKVIRKEMKLITKTIINRVNYQNKLKIL